MLFSSAIAKRMWGYTDELIIVFSNDNTIGPVEERVTMSTPRSHRMQRLLNILAVKLHRGNLGLIDKIVQMMQMYKIEADLQQLPTQMQAQFKVLDQCRKLAGKYYHI